MSLETIIASPRRDFSAIVTLTDSYVPSCDVWIGDYPYLDKRKFKGFLKKFLPALMPRSTVEVSQAGSSGSNQRNDSGVDWSKKVKTSDSVNSYGRNNTNNSKNNKRRANTAQQGDLNANSKTATRPTLQLNLNTLTDNDALELELLRAKLRAVSSTLKRNNAVDEDITSDADENVGEDNA